MARRSDFDTSVPLPRPPALGRHYGRVEETVTPRELFCRQVRARSVENAGAVGLLHSHELPAQVVAILRQELDSLVRVIYLLSIADKQRRDELMRASTEGERWFAAGSRKPIADRDMVELAQRLHGWTQSVYRFGCGFIHLSGFHDYQERDPLARVSDSERAAILQHMRYYHGGPLGNNPGFRDLLPYLPRVFEKIASNLECYLRTLEADGDLADE